MNKEVQMPTSYQGKSLPSTKQRIRIYHHHHARFFYETTIKHHLFTIAAVIISIVLLISLTFHFSYTKNAFNINQISAVDILIATYNTLFRLFISYILAMIISIPLALLIVSTPKTQRILLPIVDVAQSIPVLAFFPVAVTFFTAYGAFELAALFILVMVMLWNIVFPTIEGLQTIPEDITSAAKVFNVRKQRKFWYITLPAIFPYLVTGSLLAWAQGWTTIIIAEVLHTYIPHGNPSQDLLGLGSLLVDANASGLITLFLVTLIIMILIITLVNLFIWQRLIHLSQKFKFD